LTVNDHLDVLSDDDLESLFETHCKASTDMAEAFEEGDIAPLLVTIDATDGDGHRAQRVSVLQGFPEDHAGRCDVLRQIGRADAAEEKSVVCVFFTTMAWMVTRTHEQVARMGLPVPSDQDDREEVLCCSASTYDRRCLLWSRPTTRKGEASEPIKLTGKPRKITHLGKGTSENVSVDLLDAYWEGYSA
jgi:hypothetical protein